MACPTCDHTMQSLGYCDGGTVWHCSRCGTVSHHDQFVDAPPRVHVPKLVERCRDFESVWDDDAVGRMLWRTLGIEESIRDKAATP